MPERGSMIMNSQFLKPKNAALPNPHKIQVQKFISTWKMRNTPETAHKCSPEIFPQTDGVSDVTDTYPHMEPDVEPSSEQPESSLTHPRSSKYNLRQNAKPNCNDEYRY